MRRPLALLTSLIAAAGCGGHTAAPSSTAMPAAAPAPAADPGALRYGAGNSRYRFEQDLHITQDVMGQVTEMNAATTMFISAALSAAEAGNLAAAYTVDSVTFASSGAMPFPDATAGSRGKTWYTVVTPRGRSVAYTPPDTAVATSQTGELFREFLPDLPDNLAPGTSWVDTVRQTPNQPGMTMRSESVRRHQVIGWEVHDGVRALKIATNGTVSISGEGESQGQQLQMTGTGTSIGEKFISSAGTFLGGTVNDSTNLNVTVVSVGLQVPVRQIRRSTTTRLP